MGCAEAGLHGRLKNFVDLETHDFTAEVVNIAGGRYTRIPELIAMAGELLHHDHVVQRRYRYPAGWRIPVPVAVVGWTEDDVISPSGDPGWDEVATVRTFVLDGRHGDYLHCPADLQDVVARMESMPARSSTTPP